MRQGTESSFQKVATRIDFIFHFLNCFSDEDKMLLGLEKCLILQRLTALLSFSLFAWKFQMARSNMASQSSLDLYQFILTRNMILLPFLLMRKSDPLPFHLPQ